MDFDDDKLAYMSAEERAQLAEELGISPSELNLKPSAKDRFLITPDNRSSVPTILLDSVDGEGSTTNSNRQSMQHLFENNLQLLNPVNPHSTGSGLTPKRMTYA